MVYAKLKPVEGKGHTTNKINLTPLKCSQIH